MSDGTKKLRLVDRFDSMYMTPREMTRTTAYSTLPPVPFRILHHLLDKHDGTNNGRLDMTVEQAMAITGTSKPTTIGAIRILRQRGLVIRTHCAARCAPGRGDKGDHSTFLLTCYSYVSNGRTIRPRDDYDSWTPGIDLSDLEDRIVHRPDHAPKITDVLSRRAAADKARAEKAERMREKEETRQAEAAAWEAQPVEDSAWGDDVPF